MEVRVLFYKAEKDGHWLDDGISGWTKLFNWNTPPYSHVEIHWPGPEGFASPVQSTIPLGECYTSTMRGDNNGTVVRPAHEVLKNPSRWDYVKINVSGIDLEVAKGLARLAVKANSGYDFFCILGFFLPFRVRSKEKNICSEAAQNFLVWCKVFPEKKIWSPRRLSKKLTDAGYKITSLDSSG